MDLGSAPGCTDEHPKMNRRVVHPKYHIRMGMLLKWYYILIIVTCSPADAYMNTMSIMSRKYHINKSRKKERKNYI